VRPPDEGSRTEGADGLIGAEGLGAGDGLIDGLTGAEGLIDGLMDEDGGRGGLRGADGVLRPEE
jgi:hypothetical protein